MYRHIGKIMAAFLKNARLGFSDLKRVNVVPYGSWLLYLLVGFFVFVVIMMLTGKRIQLDWFDFRSKRSKVLSRAQLYWKPGPEYTNLTIPATIAPGPFLENQYSLLFDCALYNSRDYTRVWSGVEGEGPYRHILHRGSDDLKSTTVGGLAVKGCSASAKSQSDLPPFGLPKRMNPGICLDPNVNDLLIFVDVSAGVDTYRESLRIPDIPLDIPFRIGVVLNNLVLEVYLNCRLEVTKLLTGEPKRVENEWYGLAGPAGAQAQIQNMYIWNGVLSSNDMTALCSKLPTFTVKRPICEGADTPVKPKPGAKPTASVDLGIGAKLKSCM